MSFSIVIIVSCRSRLDISGMTSPSAMADHIFNFWTGMREKLQKEARILEPFQSSRGTVYNPLDVDTDYCSTGDHGLSVSVYRCVNRHAKFEAAFCARIHGI